MNTPTPETDAEVLRCEDKYYRLYPDSKNKPVDDDFARKLERERDEAVEAMLRTENERLATIKERDQLRKVCDAGHEILHWYIKEYGMPKWGFEFDKLKAIDKAYNQLTHVKEKTK